MTKLFAASAYIAVMSFAVANEGVARVRNRDVAGSAATAGVLAKDDREGGACSRAACSGDDGRAVVFASLTQTGSNETTVMRSGSITR